MEKVSEVPIIEALQRPTIEVRDSSIGGKGCFTNQPIRQGETIHVLSGELLEGNEIDQRILDGVSQPDDELQIGENQFLALDNLSYFFNHNCEPNAGIRGQSELFALREIADGEEITYDYATTVGVKREPSWLLGNNDWIMTCNCEAETCRGEIRPFTSIPETILKKYVNFGALPNFIRSQLLTVNPSLAY
jgi:hypothetical protein